MNAHISALSYYVPEKILDNTFFENIVRTSNEWILTRTGIRERRIVENGESTLSMAIKASQQLQKDYNVSLADIDFIIVCSSTQDHLIPSMASQIQNHFGIKGAGTMDITSACAGFLYGLNTAQCMIMSGFLKKILVIASENLTRFTDYADRASCILFGDGAGAALVESSVDAGMLKPVFGTQGEFGKELYINYFAPAINNAAVLQNNKIIQNGKSVYKWATCNIPDSFHELLRINDIKKNDIDWFVPHSANLRMIEYICKELDFPMEKTLESVQYCGNTSAASIPLALGAALRNGRVKKGDTLLLIAFGGGLTFAGNIIRW